MSPNCFNLFMNFYYLILTSASLGVLAVIDRACNPDWSSSDKRSYTIRCRLTSVWPSNLLETMLTLKWVSVAPLSLTAAWPACWYDTSSTSNKAASSAASFVLILLARDSKARDAICTHCVGFQISSYQWRKFPSPFCFTAIVYFNKKIRFWWNLSSLFPDYATSNTWVPNIILIAFRSSYIYFWCS